MTEQGKRIYPGDDGILWLGEGEYGKEKDGTWYARPPGCHAGTLVNHEVTEHEDGTITVSPSILITWGDTDGKHQWHGYLERGIWREV